VDAVHSAAHLRTNVREIGCDFLACSAYKFYGPHVGALWGRRELLESLDFPKLEPAPGSAPELLETGTQNHEGIVGAGAAVEFLASLAAGADPGTSRRAALETAIAALHARGMRLLERLWENLARIPGVTLYGPPPQTRRTPTLSFVVAGRTSEEVAVALARRAVFASHGDFYAATAIRRLGHERDGVVRAGCACYTTQEEIDRLVEGVRAAAKGAQT
jgi:selenocysteine lyase/cysteine desulfurase